MRRIAVLVALILVFAACGDDDSSSTTVPPEGDTVTDASETTVPADDPAETSVAATTLAAVGGDGPTDCLQIWPETAVQAVSGTEYTFFAGNADLSACTYTNLPNGIALAWRVSDVAGFELSRSGVGVVSGTTEIQVCDAGFYSELQGTVLIMEAYDAFQGRAYTATMSAIDLNVARDWASALLQSACN